LRLKPMSKSCALARAMVGGQQMVAFICPRAFEIVLSIKVESKDKKKIKKEVRSTVGRDVVRSEYD
jgi:hypothetical protein